MSSGAECFITGSEAGQCMEMKRDIGTNTTGTAMETDDDANCSTICSATEVATQTLPLTAVEVATQTVARLVTTPLPTPCNGIPTGDRSTQTESDAAPDAAATTRNISVKVYVSH